MLVIRTIGDYEEATARHQILEAEEAIRDGRIKVHPCPDCEALVTDWEVATGEHQMNCFPPDYRP